LERGEVVFDSLLLLERGMSAVGQPLVSVVLPTHNRPVWLEEALISVLDGEFADFEVVVSNNGDPEDTRRLEARISDPRVRWIEQDAAPGGLENFLAGVAAARGRYVAPLHDDDRWSPRFLAILVPPLERHPEAVLAFADHYLVDDGGRIDVAATEANTQYWGRADLHEGVHRPFVEEAVARQSVAISGCVFRRDSLAVEEFDAKMGPSYDIWMSYLLARGGGAAFYTRERLLYYRMHGGSATASKVAAHLGASYARRRMLNDLAVRPYRALLADRIARDHTVVGAELLRQGSRRDARVHLAAAIRLDPTLRAVAGWMATWLAPSRLLRRL
jgi:glycosyltransferase involved in cell wall biosynthesis